MYLKAFFTKTTLWSVAAFCLLVGVFVYATIDRTVYVTEQLVVIPDTVVSDTWLGVENILVSDISGESLYQEFTLSNAAVLDEGLMNANPPAATSADNLPTAEVGVQTDENARVPADGTTEDVARVPTGDEVETAPEPEPVSEPEPEPVDEPEPAPAPEPAAEPEVSANSNSIYW